MNEEIKIKIEKNIPIVNPRTGTGLCIAVRNAISAMEIGDSFIFEYTDDGYKSVKIPISSVEIEDDEGGWLDPKPISSIQTLVLTGRVKKAFFNSWEKRKWNPVNVEGGKSEMESHFPIKKKVKLTLPKETEK